MKKTLLAAIILLSSYVGFAQNQLLVQSSEKGLYLTHTVSPKENFYSVGRTYAISPKEIAAFNSLDMNNGLNVGQVIKIPLTSANFSQTTQSGVPVYYVVGEKEGLYRVSINNNKVQLENLRKWNNINGDVIAAGQKLIVGYLNTAEVPVGAGSPNATAVTTAATAIKPDMAEAGRVEKEKAAVQAKPATEPVVEKKQEPQVEKKPEPIAQEAARPVAKPSNPAPAVKPVANGGSGYFKEQYELQIKKFPPTKDQTVTASIFKTASGWQDGKYYALIDGVEPGTIIRVVNPTNSKAIYAKVLGEMSGIRQNQGLELRISNAAASALEASETDKFIVKVAF